MAAEAAGVGWLSVMDHYFQMEELGGPESAMLECYATLGVGAAWYEREHLGLGVPFLPVAERFERLEEALRICLQMWDPQHNGPFDGKYYQLAETRCAPPGSALRPEIMIGEAARRRP